MSLCLSAPHHCQCAFRGIVNFLGLLDFRYRRHEGGGGLVGSGLYSKRAQSKVRKGRRAATWSALLSLQVCVCLCVLALQGFFWMTAAKTSASTCHPSPLHPLQPLPLHHPCKCEVNARPSGLLVTSDESHPSSRRYSFPAPSDVALLYRPRSGALTS